MRVYLLRHGQTVSSLDYDPEIRHPNPGLDETGIQQAGLLGQRLCNYGLDAIYSSDLRRARETADIVNQHTATDIMIRPQLREIDMGEIPLRGWEAFHEFYAEWRKHDADLPYPQGEAGADVKARVWPVLEEITRLHTQDVAIVTHGGVIMILLSACLGMPLEKRFKFAPPANCGISTLVFSTEDRQWRVEQVNETGHLDALEPGD